MKKNKRIRINKLPRQKLERRNSSCRRKRKTLWKGRKVCRKRLDQLRKSSSQRWRIQSRGRKRRGRILPCHWTKAACCSRKKGNTQKYRISTTPCSNQSQEAPARLMNCSSQTSSWRSRSSYSISKTTLKKLNMQWKNRMANLRNALMIWMADIQNNSWKYSKAAQVIYLGFAASTSITNAWRSIGPI